MMRSRLLPALLLAIILAMLRSGPSFCGTPPWASLQTSARKAAKAASDSDAEPSRVLLVVSDDNPYLSESSKTALQHAVNVSSGGHVTAVVLPPADNTTDVATLQNTIRWWFNECGLAADQYDELLPPAGGDPAASVADVADELEATDVVVSAEVLAKKKVDASLLATFLGCRMIMVPG